MSRKNRSSEGQISLDAESLLSLLDVCEATGQSVESVINQALREWRDSTGEAIIAYHRGNIKSLFETEEQKPKRQGRLHKSFARHIDPSDELRARALGIKLD